MTCHTLACNALILSPLSYGEGLGVRCSEAGVRSPLSIKKPKPIIKTQYNISPIISQCQISFANSYPVLYSRMTNDPSLLPDWLQTAKRVDGVGPSHPPRCAEPAAPLIAQCCMSHACGRSFRSAPPGCSLPGVRRGRGPLGVASRAGPPARSQPEG